MKYLKRFNESITEKEYNRILDKISELGLSSLTPDEKSKLSSFDGTFIEDKADDVMVGGNINPKYLPGYVEPKEKSDKNVEPKEKSDKNVEPKEKSDKNISKRKTTLSSYISKKYDGGKGFHVLHKDDDIIVLLEKYIKGVNRVYYILFKKQPDSSPVRVLQLSYNLDRQVRRDNSNFTIYDNNGSVINFSSLENTFDRNGLGFGDFNNAWYYIEENYNNR